MGQDRFLDQSSIIYLRFQVMRAHVYLVLSPSVDLPIKITPIGSNFSKELKKVHMTLL